MADYIAETQNSTQQNVVNSENLVTDVGTSSATQSSQYVKYPPNRENITRYLSQIVGLLQWVAWRLEQRADGGKPTKVPYNPHTRTKASTTDPTTWGTFDQAWAAYEAGGFNGVGFVLTEEAGIVGVDIDHCMTDQSSQAEAWKIIQELDTYWEWSPSGNGVHLLLYGVLPTGRKKNGNYEAYSSGRYFTVTGVISEATNETN